MLYRRVRKSEQSELEQLCSNDTRWLKYYSSHTRWREVAFRDITYVEDRVVIGAFEPYSINGESYSSKMIACLFLKKSKFENKIELKSFVLPPSENHEVSVANIGQSLIERAIRFCEIRNVEKIEIELPQPEHQILSMFLEQGFRIVSIRERYNPTVHVCVLEKNLGEYYFGDPFSVNDFCIWLLKQYVPCQKIEIQDVYDIQKIVFESVTSQAFLQKNEIAFSKRLRGEFWILEHSADDNSEQNFEKNIIDIIETPKAHNLSLVYVDYINEHQKKIFTNNNFEVFTNNETKIIAGGELSSKSIPFAVSEVGGVVTVLEYEEIIKYSKQNTTTYYLFSGINSGLKVPQIKTNGTKQLDESNVQPDDNVQILAIYCPNWTPSHYEHGFGIIGYWIIYGTKRQQFNTLIKGQIAEDSALTKTDLEFYQLYSENEKVLVVNCGQLFLFENPVPISNKDWVSDKDALDYLTKEILQNGNNAAYLDEKSAYNLRKIKKSNSNTYSSETSQTQIMFLTILGQVIDLLAGSVTITDYAEKKLSTMRADLEKDSRIVEKKIEESSSMLQQLIDASIKSLEIDIKDYTTILQDPNSSSVEKKLPSQRLARHALETLELLSSVKQEIKNYDEIKIYFLAITRA